jgi:hypothetical protein
MTEKKTPSEWVKEGDPYDCIGLIGDLYRFPEKPEWPMYSFSRPASILWNAIAAELNKKGWTDDEIREWLQSKRTRWALDGELGDKIRALGVEWAEKAEKL